MKKLPYVAIVLMAVQLLLMLVSWIYSAAFPASGVRSLLSGEGIRWFLGLFADTLATPLLVWLLLLSMAYGCMRRCGVFSFQGTYREGRARMVTLLLLVIFIAVLPLLTAMPHAVLLSATGRLWPSPFSASIIPVVAFLGILLSCVYGIVSGRFDTLSGIYDALLYGIRSGAPFLLFYVLVAQVYASLLFCFL